jgi:hypothetical protein
LKGEDCSPCLIAARLRHLPSSVTPSKRFTTPDPTEDDLDAPSSEVRPVLSLLAVPCLSITLNGLRSLPLDPRAGYLVSLMDGHCTVEMILDVCPLERDEALGVLTRLLQLGAIELRDP